MDQADFVGRPTFTGIRDSRALRRDEASILFSACSPARSNSLFLVERRNPNARRLIASIEPRWQRGIVNRPCTRRGPADLRQADSMDCPTALLGTFLSIALQTRFAASTSCRIVSLPGTLPGVDRCGVSNGAIAFDGAAFSAGRRLTRGVALKCCSTHV